MAWSASAGEAVAALVLQLARTEALMAPGVPAGLLPSMKKLRWAQSMTAGVEGWLALPDLPADLMLTCARGTHTESMPENIMAGLFYVAKPYAVAAANQKQSKWVHTVPQPLTGKTLGILGLGAIGAEVARMAKAFNMRVIGTKRRPEPTECVEAVLPTERTDEVLAQSDFVLLLLPLAVGQLARPLLWPWFQQHRSWTDKIDRAVILLLVLVFPGGISGGIAAWMKRRGGR